MKRKFWIALLPLCGCFCVEAGAQSLSALYARSVVRQPGRGRGARRGRVCRPLDGGPPRAGKSTRVSGAYLF